MYSTPGLIVPSAQFSKEAFEKDLRQLGEIAGFTPFEASDFDDDVVEHFGIPGMHWGQRKAQLPTVSIQAQAHHIARRDAGIVAAHAALQNYGKYAVPVGAKVVKGTALGLVKYGPRVVKGAGFTLKILGKSARIVGKGGKAYLKGAVAIAKVVR